MRLRFLIAFPFFCALSVCSGQDTVRYDVSFPNAVHHEVKITMKLTDLPHAPLSIKMARSSPGRYALTEFAKNIYGMDGQNTGGEPLRIVRPDPYSWEIPDHGSAVTLSYTLYGDRADGTYAGIDATHAHLNIPASFVWAVGLEKRSIKITFHPPAGSGWKVATQLTPTNDSLIFTSPNLKYFMDCPTELSPYTSREWQVKSGNKQSVFRLALHHHGTEEEATAYAEMARAVVLEEEGIFGEFPNFDFGTYTFIVDYLPYVNGDGMEHRNSTSITGTRTLSTNAADNIGTLSHEFFHSWNVKRLRPKSLEPFDFEKVNMSGELWFAEGFTNYYGKLTLSRAGLENMERFTKSIGGTINQVINSPGRKYSTPVEMSEQAAFIDGAIFMDDQNKANTFISYYPYGEAIALGLDLTFRTQFKDLTLDSLMRAAWKEYGKPERPYTNDDIRSLLGKVTGDKRFSDEFFNKYITGHDLPDYAKLLAPAGLLLRKAKEGKAWLGNITLHADNSGAVINGTTLIGSPLYDAGIDRKDRIITIDTMKIVGQKDYDTILALHKPGDVLDMTFEQRGSERTTTIACREDPELEIVSYEDAKLPVTPAILAFRASWLGSHALQPLPELWKYCPKCGKKYSFTSMACPDDGEDLRITK